MKRLLLLILVLAGGFAAWQYPAWKLSQDQLAIAEERVAQVVAAGTNGLDFSDLTALRRLPPNIVEAKQLKYLTLRGTHVSDISGVEDLHELTDIDMNFTRVSDLGPLRDHPRVTLLYMQGTWASDLGPLASMQALERLDIGRTQVASLEPLTRIGTLVWLNLHSSHALDGSQQHYQMLADNVPKISGGNSYRNDYRPDWLYQSKVRYSRLREWLGVPAEQA